MFKSSDTKSQTSFVIIVFFCNLYIPTNLSGNCRQTNFFLEKKIFLTLLQVSARSRGLQRHGRSLGTLPHIGSAGMVLHSLVAPLQGLGGQVLAAFLLLKALGRSNTADVRKGGRP